VSRQPSESVSDSGWPQAILFDLDGTLIDSAPDIASSVNALLAQYDLEALMLDQVRSMIGDGVRKLVERAFAARGITLDVPGLDERHARMMVIYADNLTGATTLLDGAVEVLTRYYQAGVTLGVVTNKPEGFSRTILEFFGLSGMIGVVVGGDTGPTRKPAPDMVLHALAQLDITPVRALMVGDSPADIDAAFAAGVASVAVRGGYTNVAVEELGADCVIDSLVDLPAAVSNFNALHRQRSHQCS